MNEAALKVDTIKSEETDEGQMMCTAKRPRTSEDFYDFCKFVLEYANYEVIKQEELREKASSPVGSTGSVVDSVKLESADAESSASDDRKPSDVDSPTSDEDSYDMVTCFCSKPFAGRPMIECSTCLTWIHLSCAKIKKTNIPDVFVCVKCKHQVNERFHKSRNSSQVLTSKKRGAT